MIAAGEWVEMQSEAMMLAIVRDFISLVSFRRVRTRMVRKCSYKSRAKRWTSARSL